MKTALFFLCILGITCAFSAKHFQRRFKSEDSEENAVFKNRYRNFLYRYPYFYPPMKRFQFNSDSSEEGYGGDSSEEEEEEEGGQSNEENKGVTEGPAAGPGAEDGGKAKPPKQVPVRKEPLQKPGKGAAGGQEVEKDKMPEKGKKKEEDSDENEEEEEEEEGEEEKVEENGSGINGTSTNSTIEETGNGEEEEEEEGEENGATTIGAATLLTTVIPTTDYLDQYETTTEEQWQDHGTTPDEGEHEPWVDDSTTTDAYENGYEAQTDYYGSDNGYPRGDTFRTYEDEYSYYKGHGYDVYGQDYYYNQ